MTYYWFLPKQDKSQVSSSCTSSETSPTTTTTTRIPPIINPEAKSSPYSLKYPLSDSLHANLQKTLTECLRGCPVSKSLYSKISDSLRVILYALEKYENIGISFNGGKDSVVMMNLVDCAWYLWKKESGVTSERKRINGNCGGSDDTRNVEANGSLSETEETNTMKQRSPSSKQHSSASGEQLQNGHHHHKDSKQLTVFHLKESNSFSKLDSFINNFKNRYILRRQEDVSSFPHALLSPYNYESFRYEDMKNGQKGTGWDCIMLGVRMSDYDDRKEEQQDLAVMCPTTGDWPRMMRVHPILDWDYGDIWEFIHAVGLPYCELYQHGYTSIGKTTNTRPNPKLKYFIDEDSNLQTSISRKDTSSSTSAATAPLPNGDSNTQLYTRKEDCKVVIHSDDKGNSFAYRPAWMLKDFSQERSGRGSK